MAHLEALTRGARLAGLAGDKVATVVDAKWFGQQAVEVTYKVEATGQVGSRLVFRADEPTLEVIDQGAHWAFDAPGDRFRLAMEATRIRLAYLFDPLLALSTSQVEPLPHQISAVYETMLHRQPLRFLLADDPGAGKTIMAGLLLKELMLRGDVERCLIVVPASLEVQWQDELYEKFGLNFDILSRQQIELAKTNAFTEHDLVIARIDLLKQDEQMERLAAAEWDLVVVDEAHKMSASYDLSGERHLTARYKLGQLLSGQARHFLLMTATPHRGKEADFQLFMALLDGDRFEGRYRDDVHQVDVSDLMRRLLKEEMVDFDGRPLFPERRAYTVNYDLSDLEQQLYLQVTDYVANEMNRADRVAQEEGGEGKQKRAIVGFALTTLQRRLASSPNAIFRSLERRRKRLETALAEAKMAQQQASQQANRQVAQLATAGLTNGLSAASLAKLGEDELLEDLEERPEDEVATVVDAASAARTATELEHEIGELRKLERLAKRVYDGGSDSKWVELRRILEDREEMFDPQGKRLKLVVFTEHRDTLDYLRDRMANLLGNPEAVVTIHGAMGRDDRRKAQEEFVNNKDVLVLVATDAAGEGINLQRAHLMVNYDLPWNPNRIEQRFGRIHRFKQKEVCHLWNLVAHQTREGAVFKTLLDKLEVERQALGGRVFDVLGKLFEGESLRDLLLEAIRYGDRPEVRDRLNHRIARVAGHEHLDEVLAEQALNAEQFGQGRLATVKDLMQRAEVNRLVPHFIASFFHEAFASVGGSLSQREPGRFEITHVPADLRRRDRMTGHGAPLLRRYERICFDKALASLPDRVPAQFVAPGHPLLETTIDALTEREGNILRHGAILVDPRPEAEALGIRTLYCIRHDISDGHIVAGNQHRVISSELHFVEIDGDGVAHGTVQAPYLDYEPMAGEPAPRGLASARPQSPPARAEGSGDDTLLAEIEEWRRRDLEGLALAYAVEHLVPGHVARVRQEREALVTKTMAAVHERLTKEITFWDKRANDLKEQELKGKKPKLNSGNARERAERLAARLQKRMAELAEEKQVIAQTPLVIAGALIVPAARLAAVMPTPSLDGAEMAVTADAAAKRRTELAAMAAVMAWEVAHSYIPRDVSAENRGYDVESRDPATGRLRFVEVKGRDAEAATVTLTRNECMSAMNTRGDYWLAIVPVRDGVSVSEPFYVSDPVARALSAEPKFGLVSVQLDIAQVVAMAGVQREEKGASE
ncbi:MAG: helicase-related protein [Nitrososphaerota archaeon]